MKRFLKNIIIFFAVLSVALVAVDYPMSKYMGKVKNPAMETWSDIMEGRASADLLIQGDSRAFNAFDKHVLDSLLGCTSYNAALIGHPFITQRFRYDMYRKYDGKPKVIIQFVDYYFGNLGISTHDRVPFLPWMWDGSFAKGLFSISRMLCVRSGIPIYRYHGTRPWYNDIRSRVTDNGFYSFEDTVFHHDSSVGVFNCEGEPDHRFRAFVEDATADGIKVVMVSPPLHESFTDEDNGKERMLDYMATISADLGIPYFDYTSMMSSDSTCFLDRGHLNAKGSRVFTDSLAHDLIRLGLFEGK